ncbi:hypothetical protein L1987_26517 [Smallanthus sonchifolius]|uniref:Uncharacterized protein n=1 Tax=Smallanthus sonchifolius TaxID=185202 RepID=A0ACB9IB76_9ASTR|nr:hypothetical protein L1987_26517 [Smallanthus sonchifolius]
MPTLMNVWGRCKLYHLFINTSSIDSVIWFSLFPTQNLSQNAHLNISKFILSIKFFSLNFRDHSIKTFE